MPAWPSYFPDDSDYKNYIWLQMDGGNKGGGGYGGQGQSGLSGAFIPTFSGQAPGWGGLPQVGEFGSMGGPRRRRMAGPMMGGGFGGGGQGPGGMLGGGFGERRSLHRTPPTQGGPPVPGGGQTPQSELFEGGWNPAWGIMELLRNAAQGGDPSYGGAFGLNPPSAIMQGVRQQAVADAGARERATRLGLQSRGDVDPSTYGFQALMSQLQGQDQTSRAMGQADLALRQQQQENYWKMLMALLGEASTSDRAKLQPDQGFDWGGLAGGIAPVIGGLFGGGGGGGPKMGQPGFQYPFYGG